ncbi:filamentous hemagglutinin family protein [Sphingobium sp. B2D3A]|uniref:YDG domain-containing protein n=1 Tax=unclassified Sphingobium TaxID=2611147 RepID=UPI0022258B69|nr:MULTISPECIES: YDG domain-containing protein [unclassified Sphingobium]MCW2339147.1 filamentous hemagglutinin family protein [Sphingobium sp. B2D3A]MCW2386909.1 filamentous hemagglutinin family protein [Sphingobium sp. B2D3D]
MTTRSQARRAALISKPLFGLSLCAFVPLAPVYAQTLPSGGTVVTGSATINTGAGRTDIRQTSGKAIIEWNDFSIGQGGTVAIDNGKGATLNRVTGAAASSIDGLLQSTGSVYLINRNGIVIGKSGKVDVGGKFVGSTQDISNESFMAGGSQTLAGASEASIVNYGKIGSLGGDVVLVAAKVDNQGAIEAANGSVGLLAGYQVMLRDQADRDGKFSVVVGGTGTSVTNAGQLKAAEAELRAQSGNIYALAGTSGAINAQGVSAQGGRIFLTAGESGEVSIASTLTAKKADATGGAIEVTGKNILLDQGAKLDASGTTGGTVLVGGDWEGGHNADTRLLDRDIQRAQAVVVAPDAKIDVTGSAGAGGKAVLWSDNFTNFHGTIDASGATDGGRVETSSKNVLQAVGTVDAKAGSGKAGEWLLDPASVTISTAADASATYAGGTYTPTAGTSTINVANLNGRLNSGTNVTITTGGAGVSGGTGDITLASGASISKTAGGDAALTLKADGNIILNSAISSTVGKLTVNLNSRANDAATGYVKITNDIATNGGDLNIWGGSGAVGSGAAISNLGDTGGVHFVSPNGLIDLGSGSLNMTGSNIASTYGGDATTGISLYNLNIRAGGAITMTGTSVSGHGIRVDRNATGPFNIAGGNGPMTITGTSSGAYGSGISSYSTGFTSVNGDISIKGTNTNSSAGYFGLDFYVSRATTTGTGSISFDGTTSNITEQTNNVGYGTRVVGGTISTTTGAITFKGTSVTAGGLFLDTGSGSITSTSGNISMIGASTSSTLSREAILFGAGNITISTGGTGALSFVGTSAANGASPALGPPGTKATIKAGNVSSGIYPTLNLSAGTGGLTIRANGTAVGAKSIDLVTGTTDGTSPKSSIKSAGAIDIYGNLFVNLDAVNLGIQQTGPTGTVSIASDEVIKFGALTTATNDAITLSGALGWDFDANNSTTMSGNSDLYVLAPNGGGNIGKIVKTSSATGASKVIVRTRQRVAVNYGITAASGAGKMDVTLNTNFDDSNSSASYIDIASAITTQGGDVIAYGTSTLGGFALGNTGSPGVRVTGSGAIDARRGTTAGGNVSLFGSVANVSNPGQTGNGITLSDSSSIITAGTGGITLTGASGALGGSTPDQRSGIYFGNSSLVSGSGGITLTGTSVSGHGIMLGTDVMSVMNAGAGTLTLNGSAQNLAGISRSSNSSGIFVGNDVVMTGQTTSGVNVGTNFSGAGTVTIDGTNSVTLLGDSAGVGINFGAPVDLKAGAGGVTISAPRSGSGYNGFQSSNASSKIRSGGVIDITSAASINIAGTVSQTAGGASRIVANGGSVTLGSNVTIDANDLLVEAKDGNLSAQALTVSKGALTAKSNVNLSVAGAINVSGALTVSSATTTVNTSNINQTGTSGAVAISAAGNVTTSNISLATADATNITSGATLSTGWITLNGSSAVTMSSVNNLFVPIVNKVASATGASSFTAKSQGGVNADNGIIAASGAGKLDVTLIARSADAATGIISVGSTISTQGGNILLRGGSAAVSPLLDPTVDLAAYTAAMLATGANINISSSSAAFTAGGGDIEMRAIGSNSGSMGLNLTGKTLATTGTGSLRLYALGRASDQYAVQTSSTTNLSIASGDLIVMGASRYAGADAGVYLNGGAISSTGGAITISGVGNGASSATSSYGVLMNTNASVAVSGAKALTINGRGGLATANGTGISISGGAAVRSTAAGAINLTGFGGGAAGSAALTHSGIFFDGANNVAVVNATGSGPVTLTGRAGNANSYGIYQGNTGAATLGTAAYTGNLTLVANSMFLNAKNGATPVAAKLLTKGVLTLRAEDGGNLTLGSDIYAGFINNNVLTGAYSGIVFGGSTGTGTGLTLYTQTGASIYAIPVTLAGTGTVSVTGDTDNKPLIANGGLALAGSGLFTQSVDISASQLTGSAGTVSFNNSGNTIGKLGPMSLTNKLDLFTSSALEINGAVTTGSAVIRSVGDLTMTAGSSVSASGANTSLQLATNGKFFNNGGAGALSAANGRWLVWLQDPTNDVGGLSYSFRQYGASYGITAPAQTTGNGVMYNQMPLLSISLKDNVTKVYDGTTDALLTQTNFLVTGLLGNDKATVYALGSFDNKNVGASKTVMADEMAVVVRDGAIRIYGYGLANYTASAVMGSITPRALTASLTGGITRAYDGTTTASLSASNYALANAVSGDSVSLVMPTTGLYDSKNAGTGKTVTVSGLALTGADAANYTVNTAATASFGVISAKQLGASLTGASNKVYDGNTLASITASNVAMTGVVSGDAVSLAAGLVGLYGDKNAGTGKSVTAYGLSLTGADAANYTIAGSVTGNIGAIARKTLSASLVGPVTKVYDGSATATISGTNLNGVVAGDAVTVSSTSASYDSKNVGTNRLVTATGLALAGADSSNYTLGSTSTSGYVGTITARTVTVGTTGHGSKTYDAATGLTGAQLSGVGFTLAQGDSATQALLSADGVTLDSSGISGMLADKNAGTGKSMTVSGYSLMNNGLGNYVLSSTSANGIADVARAALTMTASSMSKTYTGTTSSIGTVTISGLKGSDTASATQAYDSKNAGSRLLQVQNGYVVNDGNGGLNYIVSRIDAAGTIYKRAVSTTVHANDKVYDGTTSATGTFDPLSGVISGDIVAASGTLSFADKNAANGKAVSVAGAVLTGADAGNYVLDPIANGTANITRANLVLTAVSDSKSYDGTVASSAAVQALGLAAGDSFTATQAFNTRDAGSRTLQVQAGWSVNDGNGGNNYVTTFGSAASGTIARKVLTATAIVNNKVYDGTTTATGDLYSLGGIVGTDQVLLDKTNGSLAFYDRNAGINKAATATGYALGGTDAHNYTLSSIANSSATISQAQLVLSAVTDMRQYDGTTASAGAVQASGLIAGDGFVATQRFDGFKAGAHTLQVDSYTVFDGNGGGNYLVGYGAMANGTISQRVLQATAAVQNKVYDGTTTATGTFSGLGNTITGDDVSLDHSGATLAFYDRNAGVGKTVTVSGATLSGADAANYTLSDIADGTATISKATLNLTAVSESRVYDGTTGSTGVVLSSGLIAGDSVTATQAFNSKNAGSRTLQVDHWTVEDGNGGGNYAVVLGTAASGSIAQKLLSGSLTGTVSKVYDRTTSATLQPVNIAGVIAGDDLVVTTASADFANANVGTGKTVTVSGMQLTGTDAANYVLNATSASADIGTITPRQVNVTVTGHGSKTYDGNANLALSQFGSLALILADGDAATQGMLSADGLGLDSSTLSAAFADRNAGNGKAVTLSGFSLTNNSLGNYALTSTSALGLADIARATLTLNAVSDSKIYDGTTTSNGVVQWNGLFAGDSLSATQAFDSKNAGNRQLVVDHFTIDDGNNGANYFVVRNTAAGTISRKQISATLTGAVSKVYDGTTTAILLPSNLVDIVSGDAVAVTASTANYADRNVGTGKLVTVSGIQLSGADAANYDLLSDNASAYVGTISARQITVSATGLGTKTYDRTDILGNNQLGSIALLIADGDSATQNLMAADGIGVDLSGMTGALADRNAGTGKSVTLSGYTLTGNDFGNYVFASSSAFGVADVARAALTLNAVSDQKVYDGSESSDGVVQIVGLIAGDSATATQAFNSKNAGNRLLVVQNGYVINDGNNGANYLVDFGTANGIIDRRTTSTTVSVQNKVYDGTTTATGTFSALTNLVTGDHVEAAGTLAFADRHAGIGKTVTVSNPVLTGADASNYILDPVADGTADILKANLVLTASADSKVYDGTNASGGTVVASGLISGDLVTATQSFDSRNAGVRALQVENGWSVQDGNGGHNYAVVIGSATAGTITPKTITATATVGNKVYDGTTAAIGTFADLDGVIGTDQVHLNDANGRLTFIDRNAGFGKAVVATGYLLKGSDAANYTLNSIANGTADIYKASLVLNATSASKVYDGTTLSNGLVQAVGLIAGDTVIATQEYDQRQAGTRTLTVQNGYAVYDGNGGNNYAVSLGSTASGTITQKVLNAGAIVNDKVYDGTTTLAGSFDGLVGVIGNDLVSLDDSNGHMAFIDRNAGNGKSVIVSGLGLSGADAANYVLSNVANGTANILKANLTLTASGDSKVYDGTTGSTGTVTITGLVDVDTATAMQSFDSKNAGNRTLTVTGWTINDGNDGNNYIRNIVTASGDITQKMLSGALTGTVTKVYDGTDNATVLPINLDGVIAGDALTLTTAGAHYDDRNAGTNKMVSVGGMTLNGADAGNYVLLQDYAAANIGTITPRAITVTVSGAGTKTYDGTTLLGTHQLGTIGFTLADGDTVTQDLLSADGVFLDTSGVTGLLADRNAGTGKAVTLSGYALTNNGYDNYVLADGSALGIANITRAALTLGTVSDSKTYDGTDASSGQVLITGLVQGDMAQATQAFDSRNAGNRTLRVNNWTLDDGNGGANYIVGFDTDATGTIAQRLIATVAHANDKVYDGTTAGTGEFDPLTDVVTGDHVALTGATFTFADRNAGTGKVVTVSSAGLSGADAGNYVLDTIAPLVAAISPKALSARFVGTLVKGYDGADLASFSASDVALDGLITGDQVVANGTARYADRNAGTVKMVSVADLALNGADAGNYTVSPALAGAVGTINQRQISIVFADQSKVRGAVDPAFTYTLGGEGMVAGDHLTGSASRVAGEAVGNYAIGLGSLSAGGNYALSVTPGNFAILASASGGNGSGNGGTGNGGSGNGGSGNGGSGNGGSPLPSTVIDAAHGAADTASQSTPPSNTSASTAPVRGGAGFDPGAVFGWGGANQLPGTIPVNVQVGYNDGWADAGQTITGPGELGRTGVANADGAATNGNGQSSEQGTVEASSDEELVCKSGTEQQDCRVTVKGSGLPYPTNRVISPSLRFIRR